jgi:hypothetical protein
MFLLKNINTTQNTLQNAIASHLYSLSLYMKNIVFILIAFPFFVKNTHSNICNYLANKFYKIERI